MDIEKEKRSIIRRIQELNDEDMIRRLESFLEQELKERISIEQYNKELEEAEKEIEEGKTVPHEQVKRNMKKW